MKKHFISIGCALIFAALFVPRASAQSLLPPVFGDWSISQGGASQTPSLEQAAGEAAAAIREYGFEAIEQQQYAHGNDSLTATLYRMSDPTAAYGAFTFLRTPEMSAFSDAKSAAKSETKSVTKFAAIEPARALFVVGNLLIDLRGTRLPDRGDVIQSLAAAVSPKADHRPYPSISDHLPDVSLISGSEKYFLGPVAMSKSTGLPSSDWIGFNFGAEAILAKYKKGSQEASLLVIEFPTQQLAAKQLPQVQSVADSNSAATPATDHPAITVKRTAGLISLAFTSQPGKFAESVLSSVKFGHDVTWNEPSFKAKEPSINIMVVGAFVGTGVILMLAVISGLGFALLRLVTKIFFPGKVFDRPDRIEILQLGLTGTRPNTKDLY